MIDWVIVMRWMSSLSVFTTIFGWWTPSDPSAAAADDDELRRSCESVSRGGTARWVC